MTRCKFAESNECIPGHFSTNVWPTYNVSLSLAFPPSSLSWLCLISSLSNQLSRDKKTLEEKLHETQTALETEENKAKQEHRQRLKLESQIQDLDEKLDRETNVSSVGMCSCFKNVVLLL